MVEQIEFGGKRRPLLYGNAAFKMMKERKGVTMSAFLDSLNRGELDVISDITYCALRIGERYEKLPHEEYDEMDVAMWMDIYEGGAISFIEKLLAVLPKPSAGEGVAEPGEALPTGTGTNSKQVQVA